MKVRSVVSYISCSGDALEPMIFVDYHGHHAADTYSGKVTKFDTLLNIFIETLE